MSSDDEKSKPPKRQATQKLRELPPGKKAPSPFDPAMTRTLPLAPKVASPFDPPAPQAKGFGVEEARKGLEKVGRAGAPDERFEPTEVMSPEERKHGRPPKPKKADAPSKTSKPRRPAPSPAVMKTQRLPAARPTQKAARHPGLVEKTERMAPARRRPAQGRASALEPSKTQVLAPAEAPKARTAAGELDAAFARLMELADAALSELVVPV